MGYRVAGIGGSTNAYDFFLKEHIVDEFNDYVKPQTAAPGFLGNLQTLGFTQSQVARSMYLVKKRHCEASANFSVYPGDYPTHPASSYNVLLEFDFVVASESNYDFDDASGRFVAIPDERFTVLHQTLQMYWEPVTHDPEALYPNISNYSYDDGGSGLSLQFRANLDWAIIYYNDFLYWPVFHFFFGGFGFDLAENATGGGRTSTIGTLTLDDLSCDLLTTPVSPGAGDIAINSADITVAPIEYWPYATTFGEPVYDTSTGATLRSPFT